MVKYENAACYITGGTWLLHRRFWGCADSTFTSIRCGVPRAGPLTLAWIDATRRPGAASFSGAPPRANFDSMTWQRTAHLRDLGCLASPSPLSLWANKTTDLPFPRASRLGKWMQWLASLGIDQFPSVCRGASPPSSGQQHPHRRRMGRDRSPDHHLARLPLHPEANHRRCRGRMPRGHFL